MEYTVLEAKVFNSMPTKTTTRLVKDYEIDMELCDGRIYSFDNVERKKLYRGDILVRTPGGIVASDGAQSTNILTLDFSGKKNSEGYSRNIPGKLQEICTDPLIARFQPLIHPVNINGIMRIYDDLMAMPDRNIPACAELVLELLYSINAEISRRNYEVLKPETDICTSVLTYIRKNSEKPITLDDLAELAHLEKSYFVRLFKASTGKTPIGMLISVRLDRASDLVANTDMKICDIASACGYNTVSFFISAYKKRYGMTPEQHRKIM